MGADERNAVLLDVCIDHLLRGEDWSHDLANGHSVEEVRELMAVAEQLIDVTPPPPARARRESVWRRITRALNRRQTAMAMVFGPGFRPDGPFTNRLPRLFVSRLPQSVNLTGYCASSWRFELNAGSAGTSV